MMSSFGFFLFFLHIYIYVCVLFSFIGDSFLFFSFIILLFSLALFSISVALIFSRFFRVNIFVLPILVAWSEPNSLDSAAQKFPIIPQDIGAQNLYEILTEVNMIVSREENEKCISMDWKKKQRERGVHEKKNIFLFYFSIMYRVFLIKLILYYMQIKLKLHDIVCTIGVQSF